MSPGPFRRRPWLWKRRGRSGSRSPSSHLPFFSVTQLIACGVVEIPCGLLQVLHTVLRPMTEHVLYGVAARERILAGEFEAFEWRVRVMAGIVDRIVLDHDFPFTVGVAAGLCLADTPSISHMCDILQVSSYFSRAQSAALPVSLSPMAWRAPSCLPCR